MAQIRPFVIGAGVLIAAVAVYGYFNPAVDAGIRLINRKADSHELQKVDQADPKLGKLVGGDDRKFGAALKDFGSEDGARRADREGAVARARGETLPAPPRYLHGSQSSWMYTNIPIFDCTHIWARGQVTYGVYGKSGPEGINFVTMSAEEREGFVSLNGDRRTLLSGVAWGAFLGQVCSDAQGTACGPTFVIGENAYLSPQHTRTGHLWVIANGFVSETGAGVLVGIRQLNMSDYNVYKGGFEFDAEPAAEQLCSQQPRR